MKEKIKSFFAAIGCLIFAMLMQFIVGAVGGIILGIIYTVNAKNGSESSAAYMDMQGLQNFISSNMNIILILINVLIVIIFTVIYKVRKKNIKEELQFRKTININIILAIILGLSICIFDSGVLALIQEAGLLTEQFAYTEEILSPITNGNLILTIISVVIVAPFAEEFLFRGIIYKTLNKNISVVWSIIIQALLFGVFHANLIQGAYATLMGILFGYATYKTKSLWPAIIMHITNNLSASLMPKIIQESILSTGVYIGFAVAGTIGIAVSTYIIRNKNVSVEENIELEI